MELLIVFVIWLLNLGISYLNAHTVGKAWVETKHSGGFAHFMAWMGAIMSASGFTWCYLIVLAIAAGAFGWLDMNSVTVMLYLGYLVIIPGVLFSGFMIMLDSWATAYRQRTLANTAVAGYNTFANLYNAYHAIDGIGSAFGEVLDFFKSDDEDSGKLFLIILLVILALGGGIITTATIIQRQAASEELLPLQRYSR